MAAYEAALPSRLRKFSHDEYSGNVLAKASAKSLRNQARELERNHDLTRGALAVLVNNTVGPNGISVEPQPREKTTGDIHQDLARQLADLWTDWQRYPEVTYQHNWAAVQRLECRTWLRDGEGFAQILQGTVPNLDHRTKVPLTIEMLEPDMVPYDQDDFGMQPGNSAMRQGIILNGWGQPKAYRVYKVHPGDLFPWQGSANLKTIDAANMLHVKQVDRIGQLRGVSTLASVITRIEDLKDYEESERIAAKIAASMAAYIKKGMPDEYQPSLDAENNIVRRSLRFQPGMIFDDLAVGEEIGMIDSSRPNQNLSAFRDGQLRAMAAGIGASYSSLSKNYNGTYSAQRQELVEQWIHYAALAETFTAQFVRPVWERFVAMARLSGRLNQAWLNQCNADSVDDALFVAQQMPWIDPVKEAEAASLLEANVYISGPEIIRRRGGNPQTVLDQQKKWVQLRKDAGLDVPAAATKPARLQPAAPDPAQSPAQQGTSA